MTEFNLTFPEMAEELFSGKFVQGERYANGIFIRQVGDVVSVYDANDMCRRVDTLKFTRGILDQKYRSFSVASQAIHKAEGKS
jgi:hypothetical protein